MGLSSEFFIATPAEVDRVLTGWVTARDSSEDLAAGERGPRPDLTGLPRASLRGISPAELVTLKPGVPGGEGVSDEAILRPVRVAPSGRSQWVHRVPERLVTALAKLDDAAQRAVGKRWAAAELERLETLEDEAVRVARIKHHRERFWMDTVAELTSLAATAESAGAGLYLYMTL